MNLSDLVGRTVVSSHLHEGAIFLTLRAQCDVHEDCLRYPIIASACGGYTGKPATILRLTPLAIAARAATSSMSALPTHCATMQW